MKPIFGSRVCVGAVLAIAGASAHAAYLTGSAAVIDLGTGTSLSNGILTLEPTTASALAQSNPSAGSTFAAVTSPPSELGASYPEVSFNSTLNLNGVGGPSTQTPYSITNLFDVGTYQFNLTSLGVTSGDGAVYLTGEWVDTSNALLDTGGLFTLSTSNGWSSFSGTYAATGSAPVPLPATAWLVLSGAAGLGAMTRKRRAA